jgi:hypothetical protein
MASSLSRRIVKVQEENQMQHPAPIYLDWSFWSLVAAAIQAIGSIVAIVVTGWLIRWQVVEQGSQQRKLLADQRAQQDRDRKDDEIRRLQVVASLVFHCRALIETMKHRAERRLPIHEELERTTHHADALFEGPGMEVLDPRATYAIASTRSTVEVLRQQLSGSGGTGSPRNQTIETHLDVAIGYLKSHEESVVDCLRRRNAEPIHHKYTLDPESGDPLVVLSFGNPERLGLMASDYAEGPSRA